MGRMPLLPTENARHLRTDDELRQSRTWILRWEGDDGTYVTGDGVQGSRREPETDCVAALSAAEEDVHYYVRRMACPRDVSRH
ncbi:hypothetical protein GCM10022399_27800 [Terrabacter ginsenosidimutans]|uniref:DUF1508 domain-containing protein n=1 Tax=Terrabacter ginsenosidimutans TaxID=490575 RepID=A0ABP7DU00_9MICO